LLKNTGNAISLWIAAKIHQLLTLDLKVLTYFVIAASMLVICMTKPTLAAPTPVLIGMTDMYMPESAPANHHSLLAVPNSESQLQ
jgi:hypothetical protein